MKDYLMQEKKCPHCDQIMKKTRTEMVYGMSLILDQCKKCGGIWFDRNELYRVSSDDMLGLPLLDSVIFRQKEFYEKELLLCPNDKQTLVRFFDKHFPKNLEIEHCNQCGGFWMNHGEYVEYETYRIKEKDKVQKSYDENFSRNIETLLQTHSKSDGYDALGKIATFLSTPIEYSPLLGFHAVPQKDLGEISPNKKPYTTQAQTKEEEDARIREVLSRIRTQEQIDKKKIHTVNSVISVTFQIIRILLKILSGR